MVVLVVDSQPEPMSGGDVSLCLTLNRMRRAAARSCGVEEVLRRLDRKLARLSRIKPRHREGFDGTKEKKLQSVIIEEQTVRCQLWR